MADRIRFLITLLLGIGFLGIKGQELGKPTFEVDPTDLYARMNPRVDNNGLRGAVLKVYVDDEITGVRGSVIEDIVDNGMEKIIYLKHDSKNVEILFRHHYPVKIIFDDYGFPSLTGAMTYILKFPGKESAQLSSSTPSQQPSASAIPQQSGQSSSSSYMKLNIEEIQRAYSNREYEKVYSLGISSPDDMISQFFLGMLYFQGDFVPKDYAESFKWLKKSAEGGNVNAMNAVGNMYYEGLGIEKDYSEALKWYLQAAEKNHPMAMFNAGNMYFEGEGTPKDYDETLKWFKKSAEMGYPSAMGNLGAMYFNGWGVKKDYAEAFKWYKKLADKGDPKAMFNVASMYYKGTGVDRSYSDAFKWYMKAAEDGEVDAMFNIGKMYYKGEGVTKNFSESLRWFRRAAAAGDEKARQIVEEMEKEDNKL